jgi:tripartite-type tricarboxylate transporter receptor subunit TctC
VAVHRRTSSIAAAVPAMAVAALAVASCIAIGGATAQTYPSRPVSMVVPFAAGGPVDSNARLLADHMKTSLGQPVIVEDVAGAGGSIGVGRVARAAPDGYTILIGIWSTQVVNGAIYALPYDLINDFAPIALTTSGTTVVVARKTMPANDLKGFIEWLKAHPDTASAGTTGAGSPHHVFGALFQKATGTRFQFVPYRGGSLVTQDLVAGQIDFAVADRVTALPQVRAGTIKAYAVTGKDRLAAAPDIPTVDEAGLPGFYTSVWYGLWAPKGTPKAIISRLNAAITEAYADPVLRSRIAEFGQDIFPREQQTPEALAAFHKAEIEKWWPIIRAAGITGE